MSDDHAGRSDCVANFNALRRQLGVMDRFQGGAEAWNSLLDAVATGRPSSGVDPSGTGAEGAPAGSAGYRIALLRESEHEVAIPVVANEILVALGPNPRIDADDILEEFGFTVEGDEPLLRTELRSVWKYQFRGRRADIKGAIDALYETAIGFRERNEGEDPQVEVAPNTLMAMNVVTKSKSGAEPACCHPGDPETPVGDGDGLVVVIDTGIHADGHAAGWLAGVGGDPDPRIDTQGYLFPSAGHGTFVAGVIRQVRPGTRVHVIDVIDDDGLACDVDVANAIKDAAAHIAANGGRGVISLSIGDETYRGIEPLAIRTALAEIAHPDIAIVAAAGNRNSGKKVYPAALEGVQAVASLTNDHLPSSWSSRGSWVKFSAIGEGVVSTFVGGEERPGSGRPEDRNDPEPDLWVGTKPWAVWTGTSFAAPQVAALLAERIAAGLSADEAVASLEADGGSITNFGAVVEDRGGLMVVTDP